MPDQAALNVQAVPDAPVSPLARAAYASAVFLALTAFLHGMTGTAFYWPCLLVGLPLALLACRYRLTTFLALFSALLAVMLAPVRGGLCMLINRLFAQSEAVNRYSYAYLPVTAGEDAELFALFLLSAVHAALAGLAARPSRLSAGLLALFWVGCEIYFGITPGAARNVLLFSLLAVPLLTDRQEKPAARQALACGAALLGIAIVVLLVRPGVDAALEARSEALRDRFARSALPSAAVSAEENVFSLTRRETRLSEVPGEILRENGAQERAYERRLAYQKDVSLPRQTDHLRVVLLLLAIVALFLLPFLPFMWLDQRRREALKRRKAFDADDPRSAVLSMFPHIARCLASACPPREHIDFSLLPALRPWPPEYVSAYRQAFAVWQEAAYSLHAIGGEQQALVARLLSDTRRLVWQNASRRQRLKLQYIDCLILPEDIANEENNG